MRQTNFGAMTLGRKTFAIATFNIMPLSIMLLIAIISTTPSTIYNNLQISAIGAKG